MCTAFFLFGVHPRLKFLMIFNRDEFLDRATAPAAFWPEHPEILAGRDLKNGGTWCGVTRGGRFALLTNFRERDPARVADAPSRGSLPLDFLRGEQRPLEYLRSLDLKRHNGFNLVVGNLNDACGNGVEVAYVTNRSSSSSSSAPSTTSQQQQLKGAVLLPPGVYGISNGVLGDSWVKVDRGISILKRMLRGGEFDGKSDEEDADGDGLASPSPSSDFPWDALFRSLMGDTSRAPPHRVPETGIPRHIEERLTPTFVTPFELLPKGNGGGAATKAAAVAAEAAATAATTAATAQKSQGGGASLLKKYGTRSQTALAVFSGGRAELRERRLVSWCEEDGAVLRAGGEEEEEERRRCPEAAPCSSAPLPPPFPLESCPIKSEWREVSHTFTVRSLSATAATAATATTRKEGREVGEGEQQQEQVQRQRKARRDELVVDEAADASVAVEFEEEAELKTS